MSESEEQDQEEEHEQLVSEFRESPSFQQLPPAVQEHAEFAVETFLGYMRDYQGCCVRRLRPEDVDEVMAEIMPRKVVAERDFFESAPAALSAFLEWLGSTGRNTRAARLVRAARESAPEMLERSEDPSCWGMGKSLFMRARTEGVDLEDRKALDRFILRYNAQLEAKRSAQAPHPEEPAAAPEPTGIIGGAFGTIRRDEPHVGRNDPCPCGSGNKFKKCCGKAQT